MRALLLSVLILQGCASKTKTTPRAEAPATPLITNMRQLSFEGRRAGEGYFNKEGTKLVFQSEREPGNPFYQIYLMDLRTGKTNRVSPGRGKTTCAWIAPTTAKFFLPARTLIPT